MGYTKIVEKIKQSIAKVIVVTRSKNDREVGSGFVFVKNNILVTCNHVVSDPHGIIFLKFPNEEQFIEAKVAIRDEEHDLALLKFGGVKRKPLELSKDSVEEGMDVIFSGYPLDLNDLTTHQGILSSISKDATNIPTYLIDGTVNRGNSGCPLMSKDGFVIGVVNAQRREKKEILDKVEEMSIGAVSLHNVDIVEIYKALMKNIQLGIGYAIPVSYIPEYKEIVQKPTRKKRVRKRRSTKKK